MPNKIEHVKLHFRPEVMFTSEQTARYLGIPLEKADELLSGSQAYEVIATCIKQSIEKGLDEAVRLLSRQKWPSTMDQAPIRQDVVVQLPSLPTIIGTAHEN